MPAIYKPEAQVVDQVIAIIADEVGVDLDELQDDTEFSELGIDAILSKLIVQRVSKATNLTLNSTSFQTWDCVGSFKQYLSKITLSPNHDVSAARYALRPVSPPSPAELQDQPLAIRLQGNVKTARKNIFLLPDGSGSGMAYARLPLLGRDVCLYGLNSPFLHSSHQFACPIEDLAPIWAEEIRRVQPYGPYILGGWSAGGYYSFEVAKLLIEQGEVVEKLVLIDSPCRLVFEALPMNVVSYLSANNLMGNWGDKEPPEWLVNHFESTLQAVEEYMPTPMSRTPHHEPKVFLIWASDGVFPSGEAKHSGLDLSVKVTKFLVESRPEHGPVGWDRLFPGRRLEIANMPGNHFTIVHPPNVAALGSLLRDVVQDRALLRENKWEQFHSQ